MSGTVASYTHNSPRLRKTWNNEEYSATGGIYAPLSDEGTPTNSGQHERLFDRLPVSIAYTRLDRYRDVFSASATSFPRLFDLWSVHWPSESPTHCISAKHFTLSRIGTRNVEINRLKFFKKSHRRFSCVNLEHSSRERTPRRRGATCPISNLGNDYECRKYLIEIGERFMNFNLIQVLEITLAWKV